MNFKNMYINLECPLKCERNAINIENHRGVTYENIFGNISEQESAATYIHKMMMTRSKILDRMEMDSSSSLPGVNLDQNIQQDVAAIHNVQLHGCGMWYLDYGLGPGLGLGFYR